ncbi:MAG TPA: DUF5667 domain-containing protein [Candidatus Paceibacterota bacterium]
MIRHREGSLAFFVKFCIFSICFLAVFAFYTTFVQAGVFQFADGDPKHLRALSLAAVEGAEAEIDVAEKINLDENYTPEDFGIDNLGFLPNNPLYVFKSLRRSVTSAFTFDPVSQAELKLQFAAEKLLEAKELAGREGVSEGTITRALQNYEDELAGIDREVRDVGSADPEQSLELASTVMDSMTKYQKMLGSFDKSLSSESFDTVQDIKDATAETFGAVFTLGEAGAISEELVSVLDTQSGSEFKHFKNAEILKELSDKAPVDAHEALQDVEDNVLNKLQVQLEQSDAAQKAIFSDFVQEIGGSEVRHIEVINELEVRPISDDVRDAISGVKEGVLAKTEDRLEAFTPEQKEKFLGHLVGGTLENIRVIKEIENSVAAGVFAGIEKVKTQATEQFKQNIEEAGTNDERKQEFTNSIERFHDAKSISVLEEIGALIPDDKKEFFNTLKQKAAQEIRRDIDGARNATQRQVIYKSLSGDHPEDVAALESFEGDIGISSSMRGVLDALRATQYGRVQNRAANITDASRLEKFEQEYQKYETSFDEAPTGTRLESTFRDRKNVFDSPDRAYDKIAEARAALTKLESVVDTLPFDVGFEDGHFDPAIQEIERMRAAAEKKLGVAETSLEYNDVGRAFGEAQAALQMAKNGLSMATGYKQGRKQEKQVLDFLPKDFYQNDTAVRPSVTEGFNLYNAYEFSQFCAFTGGFLKGKTRCDFADGRSLEVPGGAFPFRIPPEFVPQNVVQKETDGKPIPVGCPSVPPTFGNFCAGGKIVDQFDRRGCQIAPRCEYKNVEDMPIRPGLDPIDMERKLHPTDPTLCGSFQGYQCREGYYCEYPKDTRSTDAFGKCVKGNEQVTCQAYFTGWVYEASAKGGSQCVQKSVTGCTNPFVYISKEQCERGQNTDPNTYEGDANSCPGFAYSAWDKKGVRYCQLNTEYRCDYNYPSYLTNGANYKAENCPADLVTVYCDSYTTESSCKTIATCQWGIPSGESAKRCYVSGKTGMCPSMPTVSSCPAGQKRVVSWSSPECGEYHTCMNDTPTTDQTWTQTTWKFTDGEQTSMILDRLDAEYQNYLAPIRAQCLTISKAKFTWRQGAGDDSATNWRNFGIPDCSGTATTNYQCGNNMCEMNETAQSCPTDCGSTGGGCGWYMNETACKTVNGCSWTAMSSNSNGGYCAPTSTNWTPQCSDGKDNDSDGKIDYPNDAGCYGKTDDMESDSFGGESGMRRCFYPNTTKGGTHVGWTIWCESDYVNCHYGDPAGKVFDTAGASLGAPSSCESGLGGGSGGGCGIYMTDATCKAMSACRWATGTSGGGYCEPIPTTSGAMQCSDGKDNDSDGQIDYPADTGCYSKEDPDEAYAGTGTTYVGDANSCPSFAYSRWDTKGVRYCQLNAERKCDYNYPSYITNGANYKAESCPVTDSTITTTATMSCMGTYTTQTSCQSAGCTWFASHYDGTHCDNAAHGSSGTGTNSSQYGSCANYTSQSSCTSVTNCKWFTGSGSGNTSYCYYESGTSGSSCSSGQYWNGSACVTSTTTGTTCQTGQYWNGSSCVTSSTTQYSSDPATACAQGGGSWNSSTSYCTMSNSSACTSGQYWNGSACVTSSTTGSSCPSGQWWNGSSCVNTSTTDCPSGQYWSGSSCVTSSSSTTDYSSMQSSCASAGGTWDSTSNYCQMPSTSSSSSSTSCPSDQYWNGSSCVTTSSSDTTSSYTPPPSTDTTTTYTPPPTTTTP